MSKEIKKRNKKDPLDFDMLIDEFDTVEERLEYIFSDIDFDKMKKHMAKRPRRHHNSPAEDLEMEEKLEEFLKDKKEKIMAKVLCIECDTKMQHQRSGVAVLETYEDGVKPYKVWSADYYECPICGNRIVTGFGNEAYSHEHDTDFHERVSKCEFKFK